MRTLSIFRDRLRKRLGASGYTEMSRNAKKGRIQAISLKRFMRSDAGQAQIDRTFESMAAMLGCPVAMLKGKTQEKQQ